MQKGQIHCIPIWLNEGWKWEHKQTCELRVTNIQSTYPARRDRHGYQPTSKNTKSTLRGTAPFFLFSWQYPDYPFILSLLIFLYFSFYASVSAPDYLLCRSKEQAVFLGVFRSSAKNSDILNVKKKVHTHSEYFRLCFLMKKTLNIMGKDGDISALSPLAKTLTA